MLAVNNVLLGIATVLNSVLDIYFWIVLVACVLTWVGANPYNPIVRILRTLTDPVFYRVRKYLPFVYAAGMDFSPVVVILFIQFLKYAVIRTLIQYAGGAA